MRTLLRKIYRGGGGKSDDSADDVDPAGEGGEETGENTPGEKTDEGQKPGEETDTGDVPDDSDTDDSTGEETGGDTISDGSMEDSSAEDEMVSDNSISGNGVEEETDGEEGDDVSSVSENAVSISQNGLSITANNALGNLLLEKIQIEAQNTKAEAVASYAVVDVEVSGTKAEVLLHAKEDCTAVVAIYEEGSEKPYAFGSAVVEAGENQVVVEIEAASLPQYFEAKGYLVDTDTLRPLSREYDSLMYTRAMQEFLAKTADDFEDATVINLDEDKKTNFLVLNDGNFLVKEEPGLNEGEQAANRLVAYDEESATYTFANVSDSVKGLKQGDIFLYQYGESELDVYIIKVEKIELQETDGVTAAIIVASKEELGAEEIFQHVRIDQVSGTADMEEITQEDCPEGVTYLGRESGAVGYAIEGDPSITVAKDTWKVGTDKEGNLGSVQGSFKADIKAGFGATITLQYYLDWHLLYTDIKCEVEASLEGEVEASAEVEIPLRTMPLETRGGSESNLFVISYTPKFVLGGEINGTVKLGMSGWLGVKVGAGELEDGDSYGPYNGLKLDILQMDAEADVHLGIKFDPKLKVGDVFNAKLETGAVLGFEAAISNNNSVSTEGSPDEHDCGLQCIAMNGYFDIPLEGELNVLKWKEYNLAEMLDIGSEGSLLKKEFGECYYSIKHQEFGWGKCPYDKRYQKVVMKILDKYGRKGVSGANVQIDKPATYVLAEEGTENADTQMVIVTEGQEAVSDSEGVLTMWLPRGKYTLNVTKNGKTTQNKVNVDGEKKLALHYDYVEEEVYLAKVRGAIRRADGSLWTWGTYPGDGSTSSQIPVKIMEDVRDVSISATISAAVTEDGSLWMWGKYPGDGTTNSNVPVKIMENVKSVSTFQGDISSVSKIAAIKEDDSLWMWGNISVEDVQKAQLTPVSVLEHVKTIQLYEGANTAITEDDSLWMWGVNEEGEIGNGTRSEAQPTPLKVLDHVKKVVYRDDSYHVSWRYTAAITEDDSLYVWGSNWCGSIAPGNANGRFFTEPWKLMENVKDVVVSREIPITKILRKDGSLYILGSKSSNPVGGIYKKLMDQVVAISGAWDALTEDGTLYMWDEVSAQMKPEKMLDGVKSFSSFEYVTRDSTAYEGAHCGFSAVTEDGNLWLWGDNYNGRVGNGTSGTFEDQTTPFKTLDDVRKGSFGWPGCVAYTGDGSLWIWGYAAPGSLADRTVPQKLVFPDETQSYSESDYALPAEGMGRDADAGIALTAQTASPGSPAQFSGLLANETYNFYALKTRSKENLLSPDNLLYIGQYATDGSGALSVSYELREAYEAPELFVVSMTRKDIADAQITVPDLIYDGKGQVVEAVVAYDGKTLKEGTDYEIYGSCLVTEPDEYHVEIRGCGDYCGAVDVTFHVKKDGGSNPGDVPGGPGDDPDPDRNDVLPEDVPADGKIPEGIWIAGLDESGYSYTGSAIKPVVRVYDGKILLKEKTDYTISYRNHTKANDASVAKTAPTVTVTGKGNYSGKDTAVYKILPLDISGEVFGADDMTLAYNKKVQKPIPALWWDSKKLKNNTDYTVTYYDKEGSSLSAFKDAGDYEIELTGKGNFTGKRRIALHITADLKLMSRMGVAKIPSQTYLSYKEGPVIPAVTVKDGKTVLTEGTHYTLSYSNNTKIGTGYVIVKGLETGGYSGTKRVSFKIVGVSIARATVSGLSGQTFTYDGTNIMPALKLSVKWGGETKILTEEDYSVSWQKNQNAGTATVIFTGNQKKGYTGTIKKTFKIRAFNIAGNEEGRFQAELEEKSAPYAKGGSRPKLCVTFKRADGTLETLQEGKDYTLTCTNNKAVNDGSDVRKLPTATIKGKGNFTGTFGQKLNYTITAQDIGRLSMNAADKTYQNKKNIFSAKVTVTDLDGKTLKAGTDYERQFTYTYKETVTLDDGTVREAGAAVDKNDIVPAGTMLEVRVTGKRNYTGTLSGTYRISKAAISAAKVTIPTQTYTGRRITPGKDVIVVKVKGKALDPLQYEIVSYQNNIKKGNASVTIRGIDNYGGTKTARFKIRAKGFLWWWR